MKTTEIINKKPSVLGVLPQGVFWNFLLGILALVISAIWGGPKMAISAPAGQIVFLIFFILYCGLTFWSIFSLAGARKFNRLQTSGIYKYVRHPMYGAIIFLLNPAIAFLLRSWLLLLAILPVYLIWRNIIFSEERELIFNFKEEYSRYRASVWPFFPNVYQISRPAFLAILGLVSFAGIFIILNFSSFYLRAVEWKNEDLAEKIIPPSSYFVKLPSGEGEARKYEKEDSIVIEKMGVDAPLIVASGTSQKELNQALNQGVIIYPGSALPGQIGNLFLTGHSSVLPWIKTKYGQIFARLDGLTPGDRVIIYFQKQKFEYEILKKSILAPSDVKIAGQNNSQTISLMTCWPIGTALKRLVIEGILVK